MSGGNFLSPYMIPFSGLSKTITLDHFCIHIFLLLPVSYFRLRLFMSYHVKVSYYLYLVYSGGQVRLAKCLVFFLPHRNRIFLLFVKNVPLIEKGYFPRSSIRGKIMCSKKRGTLSPKHIRVSFRI